jgi:hypothetical protein
MDSATMRWDVFKEMCKQGFGGEKDGNTRQQETGDGFGRALAENATGNVTGLPNA